MVWAVGSEVAEGREGHRSSVSRHHEDGRRGEWFGVWREDEYRGIIKVCLSFLCRGKIWLNWIVGARTLVSSKVDTGECESHFPYRNGETVK